MARVHIHPLRDHREFQECERIQKNVWGVLGVAGEVLSVAQKYGGAVLGAFVGRRQVGFLFALLARRRGRFIHWSHMMAVDREFRDLGLGFRMKLAHRKLALEQGISSICWTYDPLQSRNANLNICRLGARVEEYLSNCYGEFQSAIEKGLPSDRFVVNWRIRSLAAEQRLRKSAPPISPESWPRVNQTRLNRDGFLENLRVSTSLRDARLLVEIPVDTDRMRRQALQLGRRWRMETRRIFQRYLAAGYRVENFVPPAASPQGRAFYLLVRSRGASSER